MEASPWSGVTAWADKARKAVAEQAQALQETAGGDLESGDAFGAGLAWAKGAADRARAAAAQVGEKASATDWSAQAQAWQGDFANTLGKVSEKAAAAGAGLSENAMAAAGNAKDSFSKAGSSISGMGALAMSPMKLLQFAGIFMLGFMLISLSFSFLPLLPIKPQKFSLLFALGSMTMLGSVAWLKGPAAFMAIAIQREKMIPSGSYAIGLLGSFWATLIARSYLWTAIFATMQFMGLLYFMASFIPGGHAVLNFFGRCSGKAARSLVRSS